MSQLLRSPFFFYIRQNKRPFALGISLLVVTNFLDSIWPLILKQGLDLIEARSPLSELSKICLLFAAVMISLSIFRYGWRRNWGEFHSTASEHLRRTLFDHILEMGSRFFHKNPPGELMSLMTNDIQSFRQGIGPGFLIFADGLIYVLIVLPIMLSLNVQWAWKSLILLPLVPFMIWFVMKKIEVNYKLQQEIYGELTRFTEEQISGIRVVKGFGLEKIRLKLYQAVSQKLEKQSFKTSVIDAIFMPIMELSATFGGVILLFVAYDDVLSGGATVGTFIAFHRYIMKMVWPMTAFGLGLSYWQKGMASFKRIRDVLDETTDTPNEGTMILQNFETLEFKNVTFYYPGSPRPALSGINFKIEQGQKLAILGPIGAGKSTLINLILRLYPLQEGEILINGQPLKAYTLESLRRVVQLVPQEPFLFGKTVSENVLMGLDSARSPSASSQLDSQVDQEALDRRLWSELSKFQMMDEVERLPEKHLSLLGEKGVNLSGGQKQRLTLARAYACDPRVIILDDVLSAVDTETEKKISRELFVSKTMTYVIIAHRLSTVQNTDLVLVLRDGEQEFFGSWEQAKKSSATLNTFLKIQDEGHHP
jgi:ATP-binding cassette subfamily B multidrug efflux pump